MFITNNVFEKKNVTNFMTVINLFKYSNQKKSKLHVLNYICFDSKIFKTSNNEQIKLD